MGDPNDDESEGGGTEGYDKFRERAPNVVPGFEFKDIDVGGLVRLVFVLKKLAGLVDVTGENGNGDSEDEGECDRGVFPSDPLKGRCIWDGGRGIGTPFMGRAQLAG